MFPQQSDSSPFLILIVRFSCRWFGSHFRKGTVLSQITHCTVYLDVWKAAGLPAMEGKKAQNSQIKPCEPTTMINNAKFKIIFLFNTNAIFKIAFLNETALKQATV